MSLLMLVTGCILPIASISAYLIFSFYDHEQTRLVDDGISRVRAMVSSIDRDFDNIQASLQILATSNRLANGDLSGFHKRAMEILPNIRAESIELLDAQGRLLLTTRHNRLEPKPVLASPPILERTLKTDHAGISDLYTGPVSGRLVLAISIPVKRNGATVYSLLAIVSPAQLSKVLTEQKLPDSWRAAVTDSTGRIAARTHGIGTFLGNKISKSILQQIDRSDEASLRNTTGDGIAVLTVFSRSPTTRWSVALGMPTHEVTAGLRQTLRHLIVATFAALVIGLALAWFIGGRIARSITEIGDTALALSFGQKLSIPPLHFKEANTLAQALLNAESILHKSRHDAHHDALTGLANRSYFYTMLEQQLALCLLNGSNLAILYIDLDGFKAINDSHGHAIGDQLLCAVSVRIREAIRSSDIAARLGGDEFAIAMIDSELEASKIFAGRLIEIIAAPYRLGELEANISASVGISGFPASATDIDTLLKQADKSMYQAKALGKQRFHITAH
jgi:diguanylate cyclase (GGDEF)-like protein